MDELIDENDSMDNEHVEGLANRDAFYNHKRRSRKMIMFNPKLADKMRRDQLKTEKEIAVQEANKKKEQEVIQLKNTIVNLRHETERLNIQHNEDKQKLISSSSNELNHYKSMVRALRAEIDQNRLRYDEKMQQNTLLKETENKQLQETILELRSELEKYNGN